MIFRRCLALCVVTLLVVSVFNLAIGFNDDLDESSSSNRSTEKSIPSFEKSVEKSQTYGEDGGEIERYIYNFTYEMDGEIFPEDILIEFNGNAELYSRMSIYMERPDSDELKNSSGFEQTEGRLHLKEERRDKSGEFEEYISVKENTEIRENIYNQICAYLREEHPDANIPDLEDIKNVETIFGNSNEYWLDDPELLTGEYTTIIILEGVEIELEDIQVSIDDGIYTLEVYKEGEGSVEVDGEEVYDGWTSEFEEGEEVELVADADDGWVFDGWTGDYEGDESVIDITMNEDKEVIAHFSELEHTFEVLVVPTRYPDEDPNEFSKEVENFSDKLSYLEEYFFEEFYQTDTIGWTLYDTIEMPDDTDEYPDRWFSTDEAYSPPSNYFNDVWSILQNNQDLTEFDTILAYQSYAAMVAHGFDGSFLNFQSTVANPNLLPSWLPFTYQGDVPMAAVPHEERNEIIAHELGHGLYDFPDYYEIGFSDLVHNRGEIYGWGLMGRTPLDKGEEINQPIFSHNKVQTDKLQWRELELPRDGEKIGVETKSLENMELGDEVIRVSEEHIPGAEISYIIEPREKSPRDYYHPGWMEEVWGIERGVVIYRDYTFGPHERLEKLNALSEEERYQDIPTLYRSSKEEIPDNPTYEDPLTGITFTFDEYDEQSGEYEIEVEMNPEKFSEMTGKIISDTTSPEISEIQTERPNRTYPGLDLRAYDDEGHHVGMNYDSGEYEVEIPGALASGPGCQEWIFVPSEFDVEFEVSSKRAGEYLKDSEISLDEPFEYSIHSINYGSDPSVDLIGDEIQTSDITYLGPQNEEIMPDATTPIEIDPKDEDEMDWLPYLGIGIIALIVLVIAVILIKKRGKSEPYQEEEYYQRGSTSREEPNQSLQEPKGPPTQEISEQNLCPDCGSEMRYIEEYDSWYCDKCREYK